MDNVLTKIVCTNDPALDTSKVTESEMIAYLRTRDMKHIEAAIRPDRKPTCFTLREIPHRLWTGFVAAGASQEDQAVRAFRCAVVHVDHLRQRDAVELQSWEPPIEHGVMREDALDRFAIYELIEIGEVAKQLSFFGHKTQPIFRLPHTLLSELGRREFRPAGASQSPQESSNADPSQP